MVHSTSNTEDRWLSVDDITIPHGAAHMSLPARLIVCTECEYETREPQKPIRVLYQLADNILVEGHHTRGWCHSCDDLREIEDLDAARFQQTLERYRDHLEGRGPDFKAQARAVFDDPTLSPGAKIRLSVQAFHNRPPDNLEEAIWELEALLAALRARQSPPRCLMCGSSQTAPVEFAEADGLSHGFRHRCGGQLRLVPAEEEPYRMRLAFHPSDYYLTTEGVLIEIQPKL